MKASACGLALTLLAPLDVCPSCGWPASDHGTYPHRERPRAGGDPLDGDPPPATAPGKPGAPSFVLSEPLTFAAMPEPVAPAEPVTGRVGAATGKPQKGAEDSRQGLRDAAAGLLRALGIVAFAAADALDGDE